MVATSLRYISLQYLARLYHRVRSATTCTRCKGSTMFLILCSYDARNLGKPNHSIALLPNAKSVPLCREHASTGCRAGRDFREQNCGIPFPSYN